MYSLVVMSNGAGAIANDGSVDRLQTWCYVDGRMREKRKSVEEWDEGGGLVWSVLRRGGRASLYYGAGGQHVARIMKNEKHKRQQIRLHSLQRQGTHCKMGKNNRMHRYMNCHGIAVAQRGLAGYFYACACTAPPYTRTYMTPC